MCGMGNRGQQAMSSLYTVKNRAYVQQHLTEKCFVWRISCRALKDEF